MEDRRHVWVDAASGSDPCVRALTKLLGRGLATGIVRIVVARIDPELDDHAALAIVADRAELTRPPPTPFRMERDQVRALVAGVCEIDQAYGMPRADKAKARRIADAFCALCPGGAAKFFALSGFTRATFDTGVAVREGSRVAALVIEDED